MVTTHETVFTVLAGAARRREPNGLAWQLLLSLAIGVLILAIAPQWWSLAFLAGWSAAYAGWGLLDRVVESRRVPLGLNGVLVAIAATGTALAVAGIIGLGLAFYSGNARGIKEACGKGSTNERCQAWANPSAPSGIIK